MANKFTQDFPADVGDVVYQVDFVNKEIKEWLIYGISKTEYNDWFYFAIENINKENKPTKTLIKISFFGYNIFETKSKAEEVLNSKDNNQNINVESFFVHHKCGHISVFDFQGTNNEIKQYIEELKNSLCPVCKNKDSEDKGLLLIRMPFYEFKSHHSDCDIKVGSYDSETDTIEVYLEQKGMYNMKIIKCFIIGLLIVTICIGTIMQVSAKTYYIGDANLDGKISLRDATYVQLYAADKVTMDENFIPVADVNSDGVVNVMDATLIQKYLIFDYSFCPIGSIIQISEYESEPITETKNEWMPGFFD